MLSSRRSLLACGCSALASMAGSGFLGSVARAASAQGAKTTLKADEALQLLKDGNRRFLAGAPQSEQLGRERRLELAGGQAPFAVIVGCSDSRVPPEILFASGLGELFTIRNAGNTIDTAALGSIEYGVAVLGAPLLVILGHENCGAVKAALEVVDNNKMYPGSIGLMIEPIVPAVLQARSQAGDWLDNAVKANVLRTVTRLQTATEPMITGAVARGELKIVGARYDLEDGKVDFFA